MLLARLSGARLPAGMRGAPAVDLDAVVETLLAVGALMRAHPRMDEIELNPLVTYPAGRAPLALDASIVMQHA